MSDAGNPAKNRMFSRFVTPSNGG